MVGLQIGVLDPHAGEPCFGLRHGDAERLGVDLDQRVARIDALALHHRDLGDLAGDIRRDQHLLRADVGVVGRDVAARNEIEVAADDKRDQRDHDEQHEAQPRIRGARAHDCRRRRGLLLRLSQLDNLVGHGGPQAAAAVFSTARREIAVFKLFLVSESSRIMRSIVVRVQPLEHRSHHVVAQLGEPVHQRTRQRGEMQALGPAIGRIEAALDHAVRAQAVDQPRDGNRLQVEHLGQFRLLEALVIFEPGHDGPLGAGDPQPAGPLVRIGAQQARYIIESKSKFTAGVTRAHVVPYFLRSPYNKLAYNIVNTQKRIASLGLCQPGGRAESEAARDP